MLGWALSAISIVQMLSACGHISPVHIDILFPLKVLDRSCWFGVAFLSQSHFPPEQQTRGWEPGFSPVTAVSEKKSHEAPFSGFAAPCLAGDCWLNPVFFSFFTWETEPTLGSLFGLLSNPRVASACLFHYCSVMICEPHSCLRLCMWDGRAFMSLECNCVASFLYMCFCRAPPQMK